MAYHKIPIISRGLIFVQNAFLLGLFWDELIFGGAYYLRGFCVSKWVGLGNKNGLKHEDNLNSPWAYIWEGLLLERYLLLRCGWLIFGRAYFTRGLFSCKDFCIRGWSTGFSFLFLLSRIEFKNKAICLLTEPSCRMFLMTTECCR